MKKKRLVTNRGEALAFISANLKELHLVAASHKLHLLGYLLGMAYIESYEMVRKERSYRQIKIVDQG
ncbi:hypothetical protein [Mesorhizobium sp. L48C026A00]|uniref:hypothetical protein n=1 Tax=Mesorhizobium sp. L48C026A00 TaxID=1287182 RepID=UPI0003CFD168|nr:hypothetical protein [Mesorhizobium sp. L48C026A00]ESZ04796.1 hypothetical protein X737_36445 [Mesorhizobium sp. L48C026A00]